VAEHCGLPAGSGAGAEPGSTIVSSSLRNVLAVVAGILVGMGVNLALITVGPSLIAPPAGVDVSTTEGLAAGIYLFEPRHFVMPFLAHALGTYFGALAAWLLAASNRDALAWLTGGLFLLAGIAACFMIRAPAWFMATDLLLAYLPMAWLAIQVGRRIAPGHRARPASGGR
jgi:hypothetical protein